MAKNKAMIIINNYGCLAESPQNWIHLAARCPKCLADSSQLLQVLHCYCNLWQVPLKTKSGRFLISLAGYTLAGFPEPARKSLMGLARATLLLLAV